MALETHTIAVWTDGDADGDPPLELIDALQDFGKSRATKLLIRRGKENKVHCERRVPLLRDCRVRSDELDRALRKVWRAAINAGEPGARFVIDLQLRSGSQSRHHATRDRAAGESRLRANSSIHSVVEPHAMPV